MRYLSALRCRGCGTEFPVEPVHVCDRCFGPLEAAFDYDALVAKSPLILDTRNALTGRAGAHIFRL